MHRSIQIFACLSLISATTTLLGWGGSRRAMQETPPPSPLADFPLNADQQWYTKETYFIMKPYEDDNDYATRLKTHTGGSPNIKMSAKLHKPEFDWSSGVRLGLGRYLAHHDKWDVSFFMTYFYAQEEDDSSPRRDHGTLLTPLWSPTFDGGATKGQATWRLNFFNWDLSVGREFAFLKTIVAHPFIGLRTALIYKNSKASYFDTFNGNGIDDHFKASDHFWGVGPRVGTDFQFYFKDQWAFLGSLSAALFLGHDRVKENTLIQVTTAGIPSHVRYKDLDKHYAVRANLDTSLGIGWEVWVHHHRVRLAPSLLFEASCWFRSNRLFLSSPSSTPTGASLALPPGFTNTRRDGNLILMGFSLNLQADF